MSHKYHFSSHWVGLIKIALYLTDNSTILIFLLAHKGFRSIASLYVLENEGMSCYSNIQLFKDNMRLYNKISVRLGQSILLCSARE